MAAKLMVEIEGKWNNSGYEYRTSTYTFDGLLLNSGCWGFDQYYEGKRYPRLCVEEGVLYNWPYGGPKVVLATASTIETYVNGQLVPHKLTPQEVQMDREPIALDWTEEYRTYHFADGKTLTIKDVTHLLVRPSGTHRLKDKDGIYWLVPAGFLGIAVKTTKLSI